MKSLLNPKKLPRLPLILGAAAFALRILLYGAATDHKHLLAAHPLGLALSAVTVAAVVLIITGVLRWNREPVYPLWPGSWLTMALLQVVGFGSVLLEGSFAESRMLLARNLLAIGSAVSMVMLVLLRKKGKDPHFLLYGILCLFFAVYMVSCYQGWSRNPQIQDYLYALLGGVGLMLYTYHKTAAAVGFRKEKWMLAIGLLTSYFCFVSLSGTEFPVLYLCSGYWVLTDLSEVFSETLPEALPEDLSGE